jgi:hypothetical protein
MRGPSFGVVVLVLAVLPSVASAQAFSFGFATGGGGHHHHGHHHHGCNSAWYGFDFYRPPVYRYPPPLVYAPPPVTYIYPAPAVQMVQPAVVPVQPSPGLSAVDTAPSLSAAPSSSSAVRLNSLPAQQRANVVLRNPAANAGPVAFRVQDQVDAELNPGMARTWSDRTSLTVEFDRGGEFGSTRKLLKPGAYEFVVTDEGWDLVAAVAPANGGRAASLQKNSLPGRR